MNIFLQHLQTEAEGEREREREGCLVTVVIPIIFLFQIITLIVNIRGLVINERISRNVAVHRL